MNEQKDGAFFCLKFDFYISGKMVQVCSVVGLFT